MFDWIAAIPLIGGTLSFVLPFLIVITIVVFIHEYGHYRVGRACGIGAEVFSVGMGPVLTSWIDKRGTKWQIAALPLGGYVKFVGDADASSATSRADLNPEDRSRSLVDAALYKRALTVLAGPVANFILSIVLFAAVAIYQGRPTEAPIIGDVNPSIASVYDFQQGDRIVEIDGKTIEGFGDFNQFLEYTDYPNTVPYLLEREGVLRTVDGPFPFNPIVGSVMPVSPAASAGFKAGDIITHFDGNQISSFTQLQELVLASQDKIAEVEVIRNGTPVILTVQPRLRDIQSGENQFEKRVSIGITAGIYFSPQMERIGLASALYNGLWRTWFVVEQSVNGLRLIVRGDIGVENLQGPVGIAHAASDIARAGLLDLVILVAFISSAIGFLNLLPIPVLDGGHLMFFAYEALFGRKPNEKFIGLSTTLAMALLLTLMLFVTYNDVIRLALYGA
ncbi:MAG: RIP metalloprotease RseP [Pseudomonadota bacterium]